ncbi:MAG TPA: hypothetical protein VE642_05160 [Pyrinomonadaceae bacterium]|nr:hypothetical protein [Pyrinomonadaceae bacterium]
MEARVKRIEAAVGKGRRNCPYCRYASIALPPSRKMRPGEEMVREKCEFCHSEHFSSLRGMSEPEREVGRLIAASTSKDCFTDPRIRAAWLWFGYNPEKKKAKGVRKAERDKTKNDPKARAFFKLDDEYDRLLDIRVKRLKERYGEDPFPEITTLIESIEGRGKKNPEDNLIDPELDDLEREETSRLICAELEKIMFGEVMRSTAAALEDIRGRIAHAVAEALEEGRLREEASRRARPERVPQPNESAEAATPEECPESERSEEDALRLAQEQSKHSEWLNSLPAEVRRYLPHD